MTPEKLEPCREAFEKWADEFCPLEEEEAWTAWQAAWQSRPTPQPCDEEVKEAIEYAEECCKYLHGEGLRKTKNLIRAAQSKPPVFVSGLLTGEQIEALKKAGPGTFRVAESKPAGDKRGDEVAVPSGVYSKVLENLEYLKEWQSKDGASVVVEVADETLRLLGEVKS